VEHAYQFMKIQLVNADVAEQIANAPSPYAAYQIAKQHKAYRREDWDKVKVSIMLEIIRAKYRQHEDVREQLAKTGDKEIVDNSPWDTFWGGGPDGKGRNALGKIWMYVRKYPNKGMDSGDDGKLLGEFDI
jgi:ribA/ribD-fused uncharacterized protein